MIDLGIAAILHDIGMLRLPKSLYLNDKKLGQNEKKSIMAHTIIGYKSLKALAVHDNIALGALEHHERMNGTGYPRRLKAGQISSYARIIAVACSFDGITADRPFKESLDGHKGIVDLIKNNNNRYDDRVLKALVYAISLFPIGTYVLLSNNAIAVVVKTNPNNPKCPIVKVIIDKNGKQLTESVLIQTSKGSDTTIWRALEEYEKPRLENGSL